MKRKFFKQNCVFADFKKINDVDVFRRGGRIFFARLARMDSADYQWTADDTGQRDLLWEVIDEVERYERDPVDLSFQFSMTSGKYFKVETQDFLKLTGFGIGGYPMTPEEILLSKYQEAQIR